MSGLEEEQKSSMLGGVAVAAGILNLFGSYQAVNLPSGARIACAPAGKPVSLTLLLMM